MDKFYNIKDKIQHYESPLEVEKAWEELVLKQENLILKKNLKAKNIYLVVVSSTILLLALLWSLNSFHSKNKLSVNSKIEKVESKLNEEITSNQKDNLESNNEKKLETKEALLAEKQVNEKSKVIEELNNNAVKKAQSQNNNNRKKNNKISQPNKTSTTDQLKNKITKTSAPKTNDVKIKNKAMAYSSSPPQNTSVVKQIAKNINNENSTINTLDKPTPKEQKETESTSIQLNIKNENAINTEEKLADKIPYNRTAEVNNIPTIKKGIERKPLKPGLNDNLPYALLLKEKYKKNFVSVELLGQGGYGSINYGRILLNKPFGQTIAYAGISIDPNKLGASSEIDVPLMLPISLNQSFTINKQHALLVGIGVNLAFDIILDYPGNFDVFFNAKLGYQYQKTNSNWFYKAEVLPYVEGGNIIQRNTLLNTKFGMWGGVGIGWRF